jgi:hypothetical protein
MTTVLLVGLHADKNILVVLLVVLLADLLVDLNKCILVGLLAVKNLLVIIVRKGILFRDKYPHLWHRVWEFL